MRLTFIKFFGAGLMPYFNVISTFSQEIDRSENISNLDYSPDLIRVLSRIESWSWKFKKLADMRSSRAVLSSSVWEIHGSVWEILATGRYLVRGGIIIYLVLHSNFVEKLQF